MRATRCLVMLALLGTTRCLAPAVRAAENTTVGVSVNGAQLSTEPAFRVEKGRVVGPVAPVAAALGAEFRWNRFARELAVMTPYPWLTLDHEGPEFSRGPYDFSFLGPIMAVRHFLSSLQWQSFNGDDPSGPVLVRVESVTIEVLPGADGPIPVLDPSLQAFGKPAVRLFRPTSP